MTTGGPNSGPVRAVVVGAGAIGLSVGVVLAGAFSRGQMEVTIVAEKFSPETTSDTAGKRASS